jgi:osmotically-inducible protein OsmY
MNRILIWSLLALVSTTQIALAGTEKTAAGKDASVPADNTGKNVRDAKNKHLTPDDQSGKKSAVDTTRLIRKAIVAHKGLSVNAQNVKIITKNNVVTLRGPVDSAEERATVEALAKEQAGGCTVDSQLEIKAKNSK